ncbi:MAG TPA: flagellar biosynthesis anti-sigma factor FlgM [Bryobacteraceae bacterium]|nr:flagellar biosynthesis anti-sigma factor FlgM [Bryobacteraceae bacterium]HUJ22464.1 flagellar biosynthesis anti-sigma factor FlgM [Bryobacteraceae bacterium]
MKVDVNVTGSSIGTGRTEPAGGLGREEGVRAAGARVPGSPDRVELSDLTGKLAAILAGQQATRAARVQSLAQEYASGGYSVDAREVSRALVSETVSATAAGKPGPSGA